MLWCTAFAVYHNDRWVHEQLSNRAVSVVLGTGMMYWAAGEHGSELLNFLKLGKKNRTCGMKILPLVIATWHTSGSSDKQIDRQMDNSPGSRHSACGTLRMRNTIIPANEHYSIDIRFTFRPPKPKPDPKNIARDWLAKWVLRSPWSRVKLLKRRSR